MFSVKVRQLFGQKNMVDFASQSVRFCGGWALFVLLFRDLEAEKDGIGGRLSTGLRIYCRVM